MGSQAPETSIIIVGGGIAGLATAIALRSPHRRITVLDRSRMLRETGALISLQPNASKIVASWGIDKLLSQCKPMVDEALRVLDVSGKVVREIPLDTSKFGADRVLYHRQDLQTALLEAATTTDLNGLPATILTGRKVVACDAEQGAVTLEDGETLRADIVIGADGIHSVMRKAVIGEQRDAVPTGISAYRLLLPTNLLDDLQDLPLDVTKPITTMMVGHDRRVIMGPGRGGEMLGIVALVPDEYMHEKSATDSWVAEGSVSALLQAYDGFPAWLLEIFKCAPSVSLWQLRDIDPLPTWVRGRTILIGDAAHGMLPTQGQGASQSVEDAEALAAFLADVAPGNASGEEVRRALELVFEARYERASLIQKYSREQARPGADAGSNAVRLNPAEFMAYNCDYSGAREWVARRKGRGVSGI